jgi:hypothetical protein
MFCSECGVEASGNFCWKCGSRLRHQGPIDRDAPAPHEDPGDWQREIRYEAIARHPEVRALLARQKALGKKYLSGEDFLAAVDKIVNLGIPLTTFAAIAQPLTERLGIGTGKSQTHVFDLPSGRVVVGALCSMARRGQTLVTVEQAADGCTLQAALPSDMWSLRGDLFLTVRRIDSGTRVEAATKIRGQLYDWGKSKSVLHDLFDDIPKLPA